MLNYLSWIILRIQKIPGPVCSQHYTLLTHWRLVQKLNFSLEWTHSDYLILNTSHLYKTCFGLFMLTEFYCLCSLISNFQTASVMNQVIFKWFIFMRWLNSRVWPWIRKMNAFLFYPSSYIFSLIELCISACFISRSAKKIILK